MQNYIQITNALTMFNIRVLSSIFKKFSGLEERTYDVAMQTFEDGSYLVFFNYPTDFDEKKAEKLIDDICMKVVLLSVLDLEKLLKEETQTTDVVISHGETDKADHTATFKNGDLLTLSLKESAFHGFKPAKVWELTYCERHDGNYGDDVAQEGTFHYMCINIEYFPESEVDLAVQVFGYRAMSTEPWKSTDKSFPLDSFLEKTNDRFKYFKETHL